MKKKMQRKNAVDHITFNEDQIAELLIRKTDSKLMDLNKSFVIYLINLEKQFKNSRNVC
jgi:hypothetical protein